MKENLFAPISRPDSRNESWKPTHNRFGGVFSDAGESLKNSSRAALKLMDAMSSQPLQTRLERQQPFVVNGKLDGRTILMENSFPARILMQST